LQSIKQIKLLNTSIESIRLINLTPCHNQYFVTGVTVYEYIR